MLVYISSELSAGVGASDPRLEVTSAHLSCGLLGNQGTTGLLGASSSGQRLTFVIAVWSAEHNEAPLRQSDRQFMLKETLGAGIDWVGGNRRTAEKARSRLSRLLFRRTDPPTWLAPWMIPRDLCPAPFCSRIPRGTGYILLPPFFLRRHVLPFH